MLLLLLLLCEVVRAPFDVTYENIVPSHEMMDATQYAVRILSSYIRVNYTINIQIRSEWFPDRRRIASAWPAYQKPHHDNMYVLIPAALYVQTHEYDNGTHIHVHLNSNREALLYFGTDGKTPRDMVDYVTVFLHECMHGLGFMTFFSSDGEYSLFPAVFVFDFHVFRDLRDLPLKSAHPLADPDVLTGGALTFDGVDGPLAIYAPSSFVVGSSVMHAASSRSSIQYNTPYGWTLHCLTDDCLNVLKTIGYDVLPMVSTCVSATTQNICFWL